MGLDQKGTPKELKQFNNIEKKSIKSGQKKNVPVLTTMNGCQSKLRMLQI